MLSGIPLVLGLGTRRSGHYVNIITYHTILYHIVEYYIM